MLAKMKHLRLLLFERCNRNCGGCCNKQYDLEALPVCTDYSPYEMIMLTGGEPMLRPSIVRQVIQEIRDKSNAKIVMYTARTKNKYSLAAIVNMLDGLTLTLHEESDIEPFLEFSRHYRRTRGIFGHRTMRLNVFFPFCRVPGWQVKDNMEWIENCPIPLNEDFMRYRRL